MLKQGFPLLLPCQSSCSGKDQHVPFQALNRKVGLLMTCNGSKETSPMRCVPPLQIRGEERTRCPYLSGGRGSWFLLCWWCQRRRWQSFSSSSMWSPKTRNLWNDVLCRASPLLPGPDSSYCHPALMPALPLPFSRHSEARPTPAPQSPLDVLSPGPCTVWCLPPAAGGGFASRQTQLKLFQRTLGCKGLLELKGQDGGGRGKGQLLQT